MRCWMDSLPVFQRELKNFKIDITRVAVHGTEQYFWARQRRLADTLKPPYPPQAMATRGWAYTFVSWGRKRVTIAFPWRTDSAKRDGTKSDRHIALYMVNCSLYDATKLVDDFTAAMS